MQGAQTYRIASQFGVVFTLTMDTSAGTFSYSAPGVNMSGSLASTADGSVCRDAIGAPLSLTKSSATQLSAASCNAQPGTSPQELLALDPAACPTVNGVSTLGQRTWTMGADGSTTSSATKSPDVFALFFADFGGQVVGFSSFGRPRVSTTPGYGNLALWLPADQATQAGQFIGTWNFVAKNDRLTFDVKSLTDVSVYITGQAASTTETLGGLTLNQWGIGGNTLPTNDSPPALFPVFVAGPWAAFCADVDAATHIGLKR